MKKLFSMALVALFVVSTSGLVLAQGTKTVAPIATPAKTTVKGKTHKKKSHVKKSTAPAVSAPAAK